ncbi:ATP synthase subunit I [Bordetella bronchialis]|nr:ATP synthase subunit I [Bordetella bronchialis]
MTEFINDSKGLPSPERSDGESRLVLDAEEKTALRAGTRRGLARAVLAQCVMAVLATVGAWVIAGTSAGLSALVGAGAYLVPNTLFALRLLLDSNRPGRTNPFTFFLGEAFKLAATVLLLWLAVRLGGDAIVWPAMLIGLICTLKGYVLLLMFGKLS